MESINTDISSYTIDELFSLLDIKIDENSTSENIKKLINDRTDAYIKSFTELGKTTIVEFFENIRNELVGNKLTIAERQLLKYEDMYSPFFRNVF